VPDNSDGWQVVHVAHWQSVRVAPEILAKLEAEGSEPVHVIGVERHEDGTLDLILRTPTPEALRAALSRE
jgi:hypothetical protein